MHLLLKVLVLNLPKQETENKRNKKKDYGTFKYLILAKYSGTCKSELRFNNGHLGLVCIFVMRSSNQRLEHGPKHLKASLILSIVAGASSVQLAPVMCTKLTTTELRWEDNSFYCAKD